MHLVFDTNAFLSSLIQLNGGLLAVVVTLVALIPTLVEVVRAKTPSFFAGEITRTQLKNSLTLLGLTIWTFGIATLVSIFLLVWFNFWFFLVALVLTVVSLIILVVASYLIAKIALSVI